MPFYEGGVAAAADGASAFAVFGEVLIQEIAVGFFDCLEPYGIAIVLLDIRNMYKDLLTLFFGKVLDQYTIVRKFLYYLDGIG